MMTNEKKELRRLAFWLAGVCVPYLLMPRVYPPRTLTSRDYALWAEKVLAKLESVQPQQTSSGR